MLWKRWFLRLLLLIVVSLVGRTIWLVGEREWYRSRGESELAAAFAETEATDPDWNWDSLSAKRQIPPPGQNGADLIPLIKAKLPHDWVQLVAPKKWEPEVTPPQPNHRLSQEALDALLKELDLAREAITLARTFKDFPVGNRVLQVTPDVLTTVLQDTNDTRLVARLLRWDTARALADGDREQAAANLKALLNCSRSVGDEPFLVSQLIRIATRSITARSLEEVLAQSELSEAQLAALQAAWAKDAVEPLFLHGIRGERALYDTFLRNMADGTITPGTIGGGKDAGVSFEGYAWWLYRGRLPRERAAYHRWVSAGVTAARLPIHEQPAAMKELPPMPPEEMKLAALVLPAVEKVAAAHWRSVAEARCVVAALACERHRIRTGEWPAALAEVSKDLLSTTPLDPYDGQPLRFRRLHDGIVVYSLGKNGIDDGGDISHRDPSTGADIGIRMWNQAARSDEASP